MQSTLDCALSLVMLPAVRQQTHCCHSIWTQVGLAEAEVLLATQRVAGKHLHMGTFKLAGQLLQGHHTPGDGELTPCSPASPPDEEALLGDASEVRLNSAGRLAAAWPWLPATCSADQSLLAVLCCCTEVQTAAGLQPSCLTDDAACPSSARQCQATCSTVHRNTPWMAIMSVALCDALHRCASPSKHKLLLLRTCRAGGLTRMCPRGSPWASSQSRTSLRSSFSR